MGGVDVRTAPTEDYDEQPRGAWSWLKDRLGIGVVYEDDQFEYMESPISSRKYGGTVRLHSARVSKVSVWMSVTSFDHAKQAADGLKEGHQQIVNLENASPEISRRIIDFLYGVIYAMDGFVEKVGDKVYLFTPANYKIDIEDATGNRRTQSAFRDN
jgi:cell division inhibitor SepF